MGSVYRAVVAVNRRPESSRNSWAARLLAVDCPARTACRRRRRCRRSGDRPTADRRVPRKPIRGCHRLDMAWQDYSAQKRKAPRRDRGVAPGRATYVENGDFGATLDISTLSSSFLTFFAAFFAFFTFLAVFRTCFVFLAIKCGPPMAPWQRGPLDA